MWPVIAAVGKCTDNLYNKKAFQHYILHLLCTQRQTVLFFFTIQIKHLIFPKKLSPQYGKILQMNTILPPLLDNNEMKCKPTQKPRIKPSVEWHIPAQYYMKGCWQNSDHVWTCCLKKLEAWLNLTMKSNAFSMLAL